MKRTLLLTVGLTAILLTSGCRYCANRYYDFRDVFHLSAGVTAENPEAPVIPASLGLHVQATDWLQLGWLTHNGYTAEWDQRGSFAGPESTTRAGFLWWQMVQKNQDYDHGYENAFKDGEFAWCQRMESPERAAHGRPAKRLHYEYFAPYKQKGVGILHQGWQYWEQIGVQVGVCEPFVLHTGLMLRAGVDPSEVFDFVLGIFYIDFKRDDLTRAEMDELRYGPPVEPEPVATPEPTPEPEPETDVPDDAEREGRQIEELQPVPEMNVIYFDYNKDSIRPDQLDRLEANLKFLKDNPDIEVIIEGHCDERGTVEYNLSLGERRAKTVYDYFIKGDLDSGRLTTISKGEEEPANMGHDEAAWSQNRRAEFKRMVIVHFR